MIDRMKLGEIAGTAAGDNTVMVAVKASHALEDAQAALEETLRPEREA